MRQSAHISSGLNAARRWAAAWFTPFVVMMGALLGNAAAQEGGQRAVAQQIANYLEQCEKAELFSGAILVAHEGQVLFRGAYGLANREHSIPNTPTTRFDIGSVAKPFVATVVLMLMDERKLNPTEEVCRYLRGCPEQWRPVQIRHLLTHTSGILNYTGLPDYFARRALESYLDDARDRIAKMPLEFAPGERFAYSNTGYLLLREVVEAIERKPFDESLRQRIWTPLGMNDTGSLVQPSIRFPIVPHRASGYTDGRGPLENAPWVYPNSGGRIYSTVDDLYAFDRALSSGRLLSRQALELSETPVKGNYGYGWFVLSEPLGKYLVHGGNIPGYAAQFVRYVDKRLTVIALSNLDTATVGPIVNDIRAIVIGDREYRPPRIYQTMTLSPADLAPYAGRYRFTGKRPQTWVVELRDGQLWIQQGEGPGETQTVLRALGNDRFVNKQFAVYEVQFKRDESGSIRSFVADGPWGTEDFVRSQ
jgi:CubicO group peptidase (beta-lactamase class C family)